MNVLITGAAGGMGRAMAMECGKRGYDLYPGALNRALSVLGGVLPRTWVAGIVNWRWKTSQKKWLNA